MSTKVYQGSKIIPKRKTRQPDIQHWPILTKGGKLRHTLRVAPCTAVGNVVQKEASGQYLLFLEADP